MPLFQKYSKLLRFCLVLSAKFLLPPSFPLTFLSRTEQFQEKQVLIELVVYINFAVLFEMLTSADVTVGKAAYSFQILFIKRQ